MFVTTRGREHKDRLEPFGNIAAMIDWRFRQHVESLSDVDLHNLKESCEWVSPTNIWCASYEAAKWMLPHVNAELLHRARKTAVA